MGTARACGAAPRALGTGAVCAVRLRRGVGSTALPAVRGRRETPARAARVARTANAAGAAGGVSAVGVACPAGGVSGVGAAGPVATTGLSEAEITAGGVSAPGAAGTEGATGSTGLTSSGACARDGTSCSGGVVLVGLGVSARWIRVGGSCTAWCPLCVPEEDIAAWAGRTSTSVCSPWPQKSQARPRAPDFSPFTRCVRWFALSPFNRGSDTRTACPQLNSSRAKITEEIIWSSLASRVSIRHVPPGIWWLRLCHWRGVSRFPR